jgi:hypothetical protein|tara:strand:- start:222 stop:476 length:255 start_codon:yes stop_codon:yes gene_type:complete
MEKMIAPMIKAIDGFMPGYKTYAVMVMGLGMMYCQGGGHHMFSPETWAMVTTVGGMTWKMGSDRKAPEVIEVEVTEVVEDEVEK